jgi:hypothetical protein
MCNHKKDVPGCEMCDAWKNHSNPNNGERRMKEICDANVKAKANKKPTHKELREAKQARKKG